MPKDVILIAIEAEDTTTIGDKLTKKVQEAIDDVLQKILDYTK
jgi:Ni,Fe-hydrogenase maturation factor